MKIAGVKLNVKRFKKVGNRFTKGAVVGLRKLGTGASTAGKYGAVLGAATGQPEIVAGSLALQRAGQKTSDVAEDLQRMRKTGELPQFNM
jgi:hypothetical protein